MITCDSCGKVNGQGEVGKHWICVDCKVTTEDKEEKKIEK
jgi:hypothetical protein